MAYRQSPSNQPLAAAFALPLGFTGLLLIAAVSVSAGTRIGPAAVLSLVCALVAWVCAAAEPLTAVPMTVIGWLTAVSFSGPPYGHLQRSDQLGAAIVIAAVALGSAAAGAAARAVRAATTRYVRIAQCDKSTIEGMSEPGRVARPDGVDAGEHGRVVREIRRLAELAGRRQSLVAGIGRRRLITGFALAGAGLPGLTAVLVVAEPHLALVDDLLLYLAAVVGITLVGGFWPAVVAAAASSLLLNWFFTPPLHTWTIDAPQNLLALLLFVTVAVTVSGVVHLAARRAALSARLSAESSALLRLARTVLAGSDTPQAVLDHLRETTGYHAELVEWVAQRWVRVAGTPGDGAGTHIVRPRADLELRVHDIEADADPLLVHGRVLDGFAAQAAAALDRDRLRIQAAQAQALAEGNRMRTALLAAVSHDLRTPLASVKASVSTLRQTDVTWTATDQAELLATIEEGADQLNTLIGNLLDMSRIHTGALQPFLRPTAMDEVAPVVVRSLQGAGPLNLDVPEDLPLVAADPGLLERALANLVSNALRYSPAGRPPTLSARANVNTVVIDVVDHGPGVPVEKREVILQPFQQLGDHRSGGGVGLGLAVSKGFVDAMGGRLSAETTPGGGLTMRVELPISTAAIERGGAGAPGARP